MLAPRGKQFIVNEPINIDNVLVYIFGTKIIIKRIL